MSCKRKAVKAGQVGGVGAAIPDAGVPSPDLGWAIAHSDPSGRGPSQKVNENKELWLWNFEVSLAERLQYQ